MRGRKRFTYAVSSTLIKEIQGGQNIMVDLRKIKAFSKEEAIGKYMMQINDQFKEHHVHCRPLVMEI